MADPAAAASNTSSDPKRKRTDPGAHNNSNSDDDFEFDVELDEDGQCEPYVKAAASGRGMGLFTKGKPRPIEYKRDTERANGGFLTAAEADTLWESQSELAAQYLMELGLDTQWYRDDVTGKGALRPITAISQYSDFGQSMTWDEEEDAMTMQRGDRNIYIPSLKPDHNPAAFANDACFGTYDPGEQPDEYDELDLAQNALEQIPCLSRGEDGKLWWSSVWLYPRHGWDWKDGQEIELMFAYAWEIEPWMKAAGGDDGEGAKAEA